MFDKIHAQRLTYLANHLRTADKLNVNVFNFTIIYASDHSSCGAAGCAVGESKFLWAKEWAIPEYAKLTDFEVAEDWFGLMLEESRHLFSPNHSNPEKYGGTKLSENATRYEVADQIEAFLDYKRKEAQKEEIK